MSVAQVGGRFRSSPLPAHSFPLLPCSSDDATTASSSSNTGAAKTKEKRPASTATAAAALLPATLSRGADSDAGGGEVEMDLDSSSSDGNNAAEVADEDAEAAEQVYRDDSSLFLKGLSSHNPQNDYQEHFVGTGNRSVVHK